MSPHARAGACVPERSGAPAHGWDALQWMPDPVGAAEGAQRPETAEGPAGLRAFVTRVGMQFPEPLATVDFPHLVRRSGPVSYLAPMSGG